MLGCFRDLVLLLSPDAGAALRRGGTPRGKVGSSRTRTHEAGLFVLYGFAAV